MILSVGATSAQTFQFNGITYRVLSIEDKTAEVADLPAFQEGDVIVASRVKYSPNGIGSGVILTVTSIGNYAFQNQRHITSVELPPTITEIKKYAFDGCQNMTSVNIPECVTTIGESAFRECRNLAAIEIPTSVTEIGSAAFFRCSRLTSVVIPSSINIINSSMLASCISLKSISLPNTITEIKANAFGACSGLPSISIPASVKSIDKQAFTECTSLKSIIFEDTDSELSLWQPTATHTGDSLFQDCPLENLYIGRNLSVWPFAHKTKLTSISFSTNVTEIGWLAFKGCSALTNLIVPSSVKSIDNSFDDCTGLVSVTLPAAATGINESFYNCKSLQEFHIDDIAAWCNQTFPQKDIYYKWEETENSPIHYAHKLYLNDTEIFDLVIPDGVTKINEFVFSGFCYLKSITYPQSLKSIGKYSFRNCSSVSTINIPNQTTIIGLGAFQNCTGLTSLNIGKAMSTVGDLSFDGCTNLTTINCNAPEPPLTFNSPFSTITYNKATLHIPQLSYEKYLNDACWGLFFNIKNDLKEIIEPVSIDIQPSELTIPTGSTKQITTILHPASAESSISWQSSNPTIASISSNGLITALKPGVTSISATTSNGKTATATVTVISSISSLSLDPIAKEMPIGSEFRLRPIILPSDASMEYVSISSSDPSVATVTADISDFIVKIIGQGECILTAYTTDGSNLSTTCKVTGLPKGVIATSISVNPTYILGIVGILDEITATILPANTSNKNIAWSSSDPTIATIIYEADKTYIRYLDEGRCMITATTTDGSNLQASCSINVVKDPDPQSIQITPADLYIEVGDTGYLNIDPIPSNANRAAIWTSSNSTIASVNPYQGIIKALSGGSATITATSLNGKTATATIHVTQPVTSIALNHTIYSAPVGSELDLIATIYPNNATNKQLQWRSDNTNVATVSNGHVRIIGNGSCTIKVSAAVHPNIYAECIITGISGIDTIFTDNDNRFDIYNIQGIMIAKDLSKAEFLRLPSGFYIINGLKIYKL